METPKSTKIEKIVVQREDELIDLLRKLEKSQSDKVLFSFAEDSDLLVSPINLKVLIKSADEKGKVVINQIIHNTAGANNSRIAGIITTEDTASISPEFWETAEIEMRKRLRENTGKLRRVDMAPELSTKSQVLSTNDEEDKEGISPVIPEQKIVEKTETQDKNEEETVELTVETLPVAEAIVQERAKTISSFEAKINKALEKTKEDRYINSKDLDQQDDFVMAIDKDISDYTPKKKSPVEQTETTELQNEQKIVGRDFVPGSSFAPGAKPVMKFNQTLSPNAVLHPVTGAPKSNKVGDVLKRFFASFKKTRSSRTLNRVIFGLVIIIAVIVFLMYSFLPNAKVKIYIESKPVKIEKLFTGEPGSVFDAALGTISVKVENVTRDRSDSGTATGKGTRGKKASGVVNVGCDKSAGTVALVPGTILTADNGKTYSLVSAVNLSCPNQTSATVEATAVGGDYNISSGLTFSIAGKGADVYGINNAAFTGGSATEYTMVSQADFDSVVNKLKQIAFDESTKELKENKSTDGWVVIDATIKNEVDGDPKADYPVGTETDTFNVTLKSKSSATYYRKSEVDKAVGTLLANEAKIQNLFSGVDNLDTTALQDVQTSITVEKVEGTSITVKLSSNALVRPAVNKDDIIKNLTGKSWDDGKKYLGTLKFSDKPIEVEYQPESFPRFLWAFPDANRIIVNIIETQVPAQSTTTPTTPASTSPTGNQ